MISKNTKIVILKSNITTLSYDCIVNAANKNLLGGGGVDGAIHKAAGSELLDYCKTLGGAKTGEAKITPAFQMNARYIIHAVGPVWNGGTHGEAEKLKDVYQNCLILAEEHQITSIAFPCISTGVYRFPFKEACLIALSTVYEMIPTLKNLKEIAMVCYSEKDYKQYSDILNAFEKAQ